MIEVVGLHKSYGSVRAVEDLSFQVGSKEVVAFLGPNGAGKTTTLRMIAGFLGADGGRVSVAGFDVATEPLKARASLGYMPESCPLHGELRVDEYLRFRATLKQVESRQRARAVDRAIEMAGVSDRRHALISTLSKGYRQRVGLADALVSMPPVLILDEPTAGLDPNQIVEVRKVIRQLGEAHSVLLSTHILAEASAACDRAVVIADGKLVAEGPPDALRGQADSEFEAVVVTASELPAELKETIVNTSSVEEGVERWHVKLSGLTAEAWSAQVVQAGFGLREFRPARDLERVFAELTNVDDAALGDRAP